MANQDVRGLQWTAPTPPAGATEFTLQRDTGGDTWEVQDVFNLEDTNVADAGPNGPYRIGFTDGDNVLFGTWSNVVTVPA